MKAPKFNIWDDTTPIDALKHQFGLNNNQVVKFLVNKTPISWIKKLVVWSVAKIKYIAARKDHDMAS